MTALEKNNESGAVALARQRPQDSCKLFYKQASEIPEPAGGGSFFDSVLLGHQECAQDWGTWDT